MSVSALDSISAPVTFGVVRALLVTVADFEAYIGGGEYGPPLW